ncbi:hypothetical protein WJX81_001460 [Elliptochloris bilobata]|uniref:GH18 domain-containing protein n=1 Tax=Elliptochloris bilobata TaxID=381761 RepID=A0AAW1QXX0_9CHLO
MASLVAALAALCLLLPGATGVAGPLQLGTKEVVAYYASWEDWNPGQNALGGIPTSVTTVVTAFSKPDQKGTRVLLAIGGATHSIAFAADMGFTGVDIDFEPAFSSVSCSNPNSVPQCNTDAQFTSVISSLRAAIPPRQLAHRPVIQSAGGGGQKNGPCKPLKLQRRQPVQPHRGHSGLHRPAGQHGLQWQDCDGRGSAARVLRPHAVH